MTSTARRRIEPATLALAEYLGPADVIDVGAGEVTVELPGGATTRATLAFASPYVPAVSDVLLIIGKGGAYWAIGVIHGAGKTSLRFQGDVELHAEGGTLHVSADRGVRIRAPEIGLVTERLHTIADAVVETFGSVYQRVGDLLSVHAKKAHTVVEGSAVTQAKSAAIVTEETMTINGKQIHLG
jgi:hypothetical protein